MDGKFSLKKWIRGKEDVVSQSPIVRLHNQIDSLFNNFTKAFDSEFVDSFENLMLKPRLDIAETEDHYTITVEVPGIKQNDITIEIYNNDLVISGEKKAHKEDKKNAHYHRVERSFGAFRRSVALPHDCNETKIEANFEDGVLEIKIPRAPDKKEAKHTIEIKKKS